MILEGPMIFVSVALLTIWHPGYVFGAKLWVEAGFHLRTKRAGGLQEYKEVNAGSNEAFVMHEPTVARMV
jgi:hypothetical protein